jgi:hypothetical protein
MRFRIPQRVCKYCVNSEQRFPKTTELRCPEVSNPKKNAAYPERISRSSTSAQPPQIFTRGMQMSSGVRRRQREAIHPEWTLIRLMRIQKAHSTVELISVYPLSQIAIHYRRVKRVCAILLRQCLSASQCATSART